ncbi:hypothetical protein BaRGS_00027485 [Batillaria attramentaria]|uniref:Uncharacterized protein n=1 Tax=Batillaria attramentaria TaxID=370345 RepID=A0ABD0K2Z4_9CAEN
MQFARHKSWFPLSTLHSTLVCHVKPRKSLQKISIIDKRKSELSPTGMQNLSFSPNGVQGYSQLIPAPSASLNSTSLVKPVSETEMIPTAAVGVRLSFDFLCQF